MKQLVEFLDSNSKIPINSRNKLKALIKKKSYKKGDMIAKAGLKYDAVYVLESGITRSFFTDKDGKEHINNIFLPLKEVFALKELILNKESKYCYDCLSDCVIHEINFKLFKEVAKEDLYISNLYSEILEIIFLELEKQNQELSHLNATERYINLEKRVPNIKNLIPQYQIASYLNITPVQFSRIKKNMYATSTK